jgi:hypothetical protein
MKSCFVIPVYPPHYAYLSFINELPEDLDFEIYLVLSFHQDLVELNSFNYKNVYNVIVLEDVLDNAFINSIIDKNVIITFKKYYALDLLKDRYDYLATCDSEIKFTNTNRISEKLKKFCENKKIIGSSVGINSQNIELARSINRGSTIFLDQQEVYEISDEFRFYFWFSDIPVYDSRILKKYMDHIDFKNHVKFIESIDWYFFDYVAYGYYCIINEKYQKINTADHGIDRNWSLEAISFDIYEKVLVIGYEPLWLIYNTWFENQDKLGESIILTYHLNDGRYTTI